ncbi:HAD family hydrolase [Staphylococcus equorum]|uniref:HAD family hydrolase n=1 Tax=Staphylococcus equorum TaxID=246432 RepID=UPI002981454E|nr:HAD family hydrolase [Staphylococcus equorum]MDW5470428.1 HAD family hydrolase [Staphylococcus equorum]
MLKSYHSKSEKAVYNYYVTTLITLKEEFLIKNTKLVLFDLDNTLFLFNDLWLIPKKYTYYDKNIWLKHSRGEITLDELRQLRLIESLKYFKKNIKTKEAHEYFLAFFDIIIQHIKSNITLNNHLNELKKWVNIGILTNGKNSEQTTKIARLELKKIFGNNIFISEDIGSEKPDSAAFLKGTHTLNIKPEDTIYVGYSWENDVSGSLNLGMKPIWFNGDKKRDDKNIEVTNSSIEKFDNTSKTINKKTVMHHA